MAPNTPTTPQLTQEERVMLAVKAIQVLGQLPNGRYQLSIRKAAELHGTPKSAVLDRLHGKQTRQEAHEPQRRLFTEQEDILVLWLKVCWQFYTYNYINYIYVSVYRF